MTSSTYPVDILKDRNQIFLIAVVPMAPQIDQTVPLSNIGQAAGMLHFIVPFSQASSTTGTGCQGRFQKEIVNILFFSVLFATNNLSVRSFPQMIHIPRWVWRKHILHQNSPRNSFRLNHMIRSRYITVALATPTPTVSNDPGPDDDLMRWEEMYQQGGLTTMRYLQVIPCFVL